MASPKLTLNVHVPWNDVAEVLDLPKGQEALPLETHCPFCSGNRLGIYDSTSGGQWHYCFDCEHAGDMIRLAADVWGVTVEEAFHKLNETIEVPEGRGTEEDLQEYRRWYAEYEENIEQLWQRSRENLVHCDSGPIKKLRRKLCIDDRLTLERRRNGPATLFGATTALDVNDTFRPAVHIREGFGRIFRGGKWKDVLLVPYFSAPKKIEGFVVIGRQGVARDDMFMLPRAKGCAARNIGLAGLQHVDGFGQHVVAVSDPVLMLRLQMRHFRNSLKPLPVVCWYDGRRGRTTSWDGLGQRQPVFWSMHPSAELFRQLRETDGQLVIRGPRDPKDIGHWLRLESSANLVPQLIDQAKPWQEALGRWLDRTPEPKVLRFLAKLSDEEREFLRDTFPKHKVVQPRDGYRRQKVGDKRFTEKNGRWFVEQPGRMPEKEFLPAIVRIERYVERKLPQWSGRVFIQGEEIPFDFSAPPRMNGRVFDQLLRDELNRKGYAIKSRGLRFSIEQVARAFHPPKVVSGIETVGWDGEAFHFPHLSIQDGRCWRLDPYQAPKGNVGPTTKVAALIKNDRQHLTATGPEFAAMWAAFTGFAASVLAAPAGHEGEGLLVVGRHTQSLSKSLLRRMGASSDRKPGQSYDDWPHHWPLCINMGKLDKLEVMLSLPRGRVVGYANSDLRLVAATYGRINVVRYEQLRADLSVLEPVALGRLLLTYVRDVSRRSFQLPAGPTWYDTVADDVERWLLGQGFDPTAMREGRKMVLPAGDGRIWQHLVAQVYRNRGLVIGDGVDFDDHSLYVSREALLSAKVNGYGMSFDLMPLPHAPDTIVVPRSLLTCRPSRESTRG